MQSSIKIIKRGHDEKHKQDGDSDRTETSEPKKSLERRRRNITSTINGWIAELQERKRVQLSSRLSLPAICNVATEILKQQSPENFSRKVWGAATCVRILSKMELE